MKENDIKEKLLKTFRSFYNRNMWEVFTDFVSMSAYTVSNSVDKQNFKEREEQYLALAAKYSKEEINKFPQMLAELIMAFEKSVENGEVCDVLGWIFEKLELHNKYKSQYFTPEHICKFIAKITVGDNPDRIIEEKGFVTVNEPCCGSGRLLLAFAEVLRENGYNYSKNMFAVAQDVDFKCVCMTYLQLSFYGIPAIVIHGNSLAENNYSYWYTPVYYFDGWYRRKIFEKSISEDMKSREVSADIQVSIDELLNGGKING